MSKTNEISFKEIDNLIMSWAERDIPHKEMCAALVMTLSMIIGAFPTSEEEFEALLKEIANEKLIKQLKTAAIEFRKQMRT